MSRPPTVLELILPDGISAGSLVLGSGAPERLVPTTGDSRPADLALIAPSGEEAAEPGWLEDAVAGAARGLAPSGTMYLLLPARLRTTAQRMLRAQGFDARRAFLHHPSFERSEHVVPVERPALRYWIDETGTLDRTRRRIAGFALALPGGSRAVPSVHPSIGVAAHRPGASPPFTWLARLAGVPVAHGLVRAKWRSGRGGAVVTGLSDGGAPVVVAKVPLGGDAAEERAGRELSCLERLGPAAREAGVLVPKGRLAALGGWPILVLDVVPGAPASGMIEGGTITPGTVASRLGDWLVRWSRLTRRPGRLDQVWVERELLAPAAALAPEIPEGERYRDWLRDAASAAAGRSLATVATHGDLTMSNVLVGGQRLGIVDWEAASAAGLPLRDFLYAAVDAEAARYHYTDRPTAFERCFPPGGAPAPHLAGPFETLREVAGLDHATADLCQQACWLQHAADERVKRAGGEARPFLAIVRRLAAAAAGTGRSR